MPAPSRSASFVRRHPYLVAYLVALVAVWAFSAVTWSVRPGRSPELDPVSQALQYLLVVLAGTLAAVRARLAPPDDGADGGFRWSDREWRIADDVGARSFWVAVGVGIAAMEANVAFLILADLVAGGGAAGIDTYLEWLGAGLGAGAVIGTFAAVLALLAAFAVGRLRPKPTRS